MRKWPRHDKRYGVEASYRIGMQWLESCDLVEDWGCGSGYAKNYRVGKYLGIDGTEGYCDVVADLATLDSSPDGIFMRHVLEHNLEWRPILENALKSFKCRMSLIFFTPWAEKTHVAHEWESIPFIRFRKVEILDLIRPYFVREIVVPRPEKLMMDTIFCLEKNKDNGPDRLGNQDDR